MGHAVRQFDKEVSFKLGTGVEFVTSNCMGRPVRQFKKEVIFILETGVGYVTSSCIESQFGEPGGTSPPRIPRSTPLEK